MIPVVDRDGQASCRFNRLDRVIVEQFDRLRVAVGLDYYVLKAETVASVETWKVF